MKEFDATKSPKMIDELKNIASSKLEDVYIWHINDDIMNVDQSDANREDDVHAFIYCAKQSKFTRKEIIDYITKFKWSLSEFYEAKDDSFYIKKQIIQNCRKLDELMPAPFLPHELKNIFDDN